MSTETIAAPKIFVCHSEQDAQLVSALVDLLETALFLRGRDVFCTSLPGHCLPPGARLEEAIKEMVLKSGVFLYVVTNDSLRSDWVSGEFNMRLTLPEEARAILPVRLPNVSDTHLSPRLMGFNVVALNSPAVLHALLTEIAAKLRLESRAEPEIYQARIEAVLQTTTKERTNSANSEPAPLSGQKRLMQFFVVGSGVGKTFFMLPMGPNSDSDELDKFLKLLADLGLSDSSAYRELLKVDDSTAAGIERAADALASIYTLVQETGSDEEFAWFRMGQLVQDYAIRWVRAEQSPDSADAMLRDADAMLAAVATLVEQLNPPGGLSTEISKFLTLAREDADAAALLKKANDVVNCAYFLL